MVPEKSSCLIFLACPQTFPSRRGKILHEEKRGSQVFIQKVLVKEGDIVGRAQRFFVWAIPTCYSHCLQNVLDTSFGHLNQKTHYITFHFFWVGGGGGGGGGGAREGLPCMKHWEWTGN